jgi:exosortase
MQTDKQAEAGILEEFQRELGDCWRRLPNKGFLLALLAAWLALFQFLGNSSFGYINTPSLFQWMLGAYTTHQPDGSLTDDSIGLWVGPLVLALFWWKRKELLELPLKIWWPGLLLAACGMMLHVLGYLIQQPKVSIMAMLVGIYGLMGLAWGAEWLRKSLFPFFLLLFCIPFGSQLDFVTVRLQILVCQIVEWICHYLLAIDVIREGTILKDPANTYHYEVAAACSGIRSLVTIGLMATIGAFIYFQGWWRRLLLIASAVPLAVIGNAVRLLTIILAADIWGQEGGSYVHEGGPLGIISLLPYVPAFLGLLAAGKLLSGKKNSVPKPV